MIAKAADQLRMERARANREKHELPFEIQLRTVGFPPWEREYRFAAVAVGWDCAPGAKNAPGLKERLQRAGYSDWKIDFAWPAHRIALEIEGAPGHGRHTRPIGFRSDIIKYNALTMLGWELYRVTGDMVHSGAAINMLVQVFEKREIVVGNES